MVLQTAERVSSHEASDNVIFQRHLVAYNEAAKLIYGNVLEVGDYVDYHGRGNKATHRKIISLEKKGIETISEGGQQRFFQSLHCKKVS